MFESERNNYGFQNMLSFYAFMMNSEIIYITFNILP